MILYLLIYPVHIHTYVYYIYIYIHKLVQNRFKTFFFLSCVFKNKNKKVKDGWIVSWHSAALGQTQTQHSLHALVVMETQVWFFQLTGRVRLLLGFDWQSGFGAASPRLFAEGQSWSQHQSHGLARLFDSTPWVGRVFLWERHLVGRVLVPF